MNIKQSIFAAFAAMSLAIAHAGAAVNTAPIFAGSTVTGAALSQPAEKTDKQPETPAKDSDKSDGKVDDRATDGKTRAAIITFGDEENGDMVGIFATADSFRKTIKMLKDEKVDIVVVRFKSGGGMLLEIQRLSDVFHNEFKKDFRLVAWIDSAISAAAMSAHCFEEIYFTPQGNYGACTGWSGALKAMKGVGLEQALIMMEKISVRGNHDPKIMRAMQISAKPAESEELQIAPPWGALSATVDKNTGEVRYFQDDTSGEVVLNPRGGVNILTFSAPLAAQVKFSAGTASSLDELGKAMGLTEVEWVGKKDKRFIWPVSKAEESLLSFRKQTKTDQDNFGRYINNLNNFLGMAESASAEERGKFIGQARQWLNQVKSMVRNNPNFALLQFGGQDEFNQWVERVEKFIKDLSRRGR